MRAVLVVAALALAGVVSLAARQAPPSPADLARQIQAHYATVRDFTADFSQISKGGFLRANEGKGKVFILKPGRMRWTYTTRDKTEMVSDGTFIYTYWPIDKAGSKEPLPSVDSSTELMFLAGRGDLIRDFTASVPALQPDSEWQLVLAPKRQDADFTSLTLMVDRRTLRLTGLGKIDKSGQEYLFRFTNLRENVGLMDKDFKFTFPAGTHFIR